MKNIIDASTLGRSTGIGSDVYCPPIGEGEYILTPPPGDAPAIHGPDRFGVRPGSPFHYTIPTTGKRPMEFSVRNLPDGLNVDPAEGLITGTIADRAERTYPVKFVAKNEAGVAEKEFEIVQGRAICLTPPLGWNSWNCWTNRVDQEKVLATAEAMVRKGLINHGWTYVNIDDTWQGERGGTGNAIQPNEKFPDMKGLCDAIHAMGLKVGIYSTPWITSYAIYCGGSSDNENGAWSSQIPDGWSHGKFKFDARDVAQWAEWGMDYLKYDWRPNDGESTRRMAGALDAAGRDIVYSLSNSAPIGLGPLLLDEVNAYRTTGDIRDTWSMGKGDPTDLVGIYDIWEFHESWAGFTRPGHFPDPDMLVVGKVGWDGHPQPTKLTPDEQYTHISLWCLWSAPLLIGCPIEEMSDFTLGLLTNSEVLSVNQDSLCVMGRTTKNGTARIVTKPLKDGSIAVGLFNTGDEPQRVDAGWDVLGVSGRKRVRDLWRQKDIGGFEGHFAAMVPPHGVVLVRLSD